MSWLIAFAGFAALIVLHEFGHFIVAKAVGMRVERFSIGFGPGILKRKSKSGTIFQLAPIYRARIIDLFWLVAPETHVNGLVVSWMDVVLPLTLLALWGGLFLQQLRQRPLLPLHDPQFEEALGPALAHANHPGTAH